MLFFLRVEGPLCGCHEQVQPMQPCLGLSDDVVEKGDKVFCQPRHGGGVEQVGPVLPAPAQALRRLLHEERDIKPRDLTVEVQQVHM